MEGNGKCPEHLVALRHSEQLVARGRFPVFFKIVRMEFRHEVLERECKQRLAFNGNPIFNAVIFNPGEDLLNLFVGRDFLGIEEVDAVVLVLVHNVRRDIARIQDGNLSWCVPVDLVRFKEGILRTHAVIGELLESEEVDVCVRGGDGVIGDSEEDTVRFPLLWVWSRVDDEGVRRDRV